MGHLILPRRRPPNDPTRCHQQSNKVTKDPSNKNNIDKNQNVAMKDHIVNCHFRFVTIGRDFRRRAMTENTKENMSTKRRLPNVAIFALVIFILMQTGCAKGHQTNNSTLLAEKALPLKPSYVVLASQYIEPGAPYRVVVTLYRTSRRVTSSSLGQLFNLPSTIYVRILRQGTVIASETRECYVETTEIVIIKIPDHFRTDDDSTSYSLDVEGNVYGKLHGSLFQHTSKISLKRPNVRVVLQTEQLVYRQKQTVRIRAIPVRYDARPWLEPIDVYLADPRGMEMARWSARSAASGPIQVEYELAEPTLFGRWTVTSSARGTAAQKTRSSIHFEVVDYDPIGFEVRVWTRSSYIPSDGAIEGWVEAELLGGGAPVQGWLAMNATLKAPNGVTCEKAIRFNKPEQINIKNRISFSDGSLEKTPFVGRYEYSLQWSELEDSCGFHKIREDQTELQLTASVTRQENQQRVSAFTNTILHKNNLKMGFSLASPATFHPDLPFIAWIWVQRGDGRPLTPRVLEDSQLMMSADLEWEDGTTKTIQPFHLLRSRLRGNNKHLWKLILDLHQHVQDRSLVGLKSVRAEAKFLMDEQASVHLKDMTGTSEMILIPMKDHIDPDRPINQLQITTSTINPKVGENIILHIRSNFFLRDFHCVVTSAGQILTTKLVNMGQSRLQTFDELVTAEMSPEATFSVWHVDERGDLISSSMTVLVHSHERARISAHPVLDGNSGYSQVSVTGEANSVLSLAASNADQQERIGFTPNFFNNFEERNLLVQNGIPFPGKLESDADEQLIVMTDGARGNSGERRRFARNGGMPINEACRGDIVKCDGQCQCATCEDEVDCVAMAHHHINSSPTLNELSPTGFWRVVRIPANGTATFRVPFNVQGRISISALSLGNRGISSIRGQTLSMGGFIRSHIELPSTCRLGERISLRLTSINRGPGTFKRTYEISATGGDGTFHFLNSQGDRLDLAVRRIELTVPPNSNQMVYIPLVPLQAGPITIRARVDNTADQMVAQTIVSVEGVTIESSQVRGVNLNGRSYFVGTINASNPFAVQSEATLTISAGIVGPLVPFNVTHAIGQPQITSDEAIFTISMILNERSHHRSNANRGRVSEVSDLALRSTLSQAFQRLLAHQHHDGAISYYRTDKGGEPSVFLTANALRALYEVHSHFDTPIIDPVILFRSLNWLMRQQTEDGSFKEVFVYNGEYQRKLPIEFQEIALTAHVMIALSPFIEKGALWNVTFPIAKGAQYLVSRLGSLDQSATSLDTALVARALQVTKSHGAEAAFEILAKRRRDLADVSFWGHPEDCDASLSVRATAYALMVYTERGEFMTDPIVKWINSRRKSASGWGSTIDTMVATEALVAWSARFGTSRTSGNLSKNDLANFHNSPGSLVLEVDPQGEDGEYDVNRRRPIVVIASGSDSTRVVPLGNLTRSVKIEARGSGMALIHLRTRYKTTNLRHLLKESETGKNNVAINLEPRLEFLGPDSPEIRVLTCQRWDCNKDSSVSGPAVLSVSMPTGYILDKDEIDKISKLGFQVWIREQTIFVFFQKLTSEFECVDFILRRNFPVARLSPYIEMKVFDWFSPDRRNETLLFVPKLNSVSICDVCASSDCSQCSSVRPTNLASHASNSLVKTSRKFIHLLFGALIFSVAVM